MKIYFKFILLLTLIFTQKIHSHVFLLEKKPQEIFVRVLLSERNSKFKNQFQIKSNEPFLFETPHYNKKILVQDKKINIKIYDDKIKIPVRKKGKASLKTINSNELKISSSKNESLELNGTPYQGSIIFKIQPKSNKLFIINKLKLDDYIYSVLLSEIYQTWPHEMQKVQAVVSRTYAIYHMKQNQNRSKKLTYDIKKSNFHQKYNGYHNHKHLQEAIDETKGIIVTHNNKVALTMFDACCGGIVPAKMDYLDFNKAPYLARTTPCNYCKNYSLYNWKKEINANDFLQQLKNNTNITSKLINCGNLLKIIVIKKDAAGIIKQVKLICSKKNIILTGNQLWDSMKNKIFSLNFSISKISDKIKIEGKGFGHQMGLCQRGAKELVNQGWDFKKIINFYYPGTTFSTLKYAEI